MSKSYAGQKLDSFRTEQSEMSDEELLQRCRKELDRLIRNGLVQMSVPVKVTDGDMIFIELMRRYENN